MPEVAQIYLGNIQQDPVLAEQIDSLKASQQLLEVYLQQSDRAKGRISCTSTSGVAIGIIKSRNTKIETGDIYQTQSNLLLLINLIEEKLLVLQLPEMEIGSACKLIQLGHLLGNQHYPIQIIDHKIYVQLRSNQGHVDKSEDIIIQMIKEIGIPGLMITKETLKQPLEIT